MGFYNFAKILMKVFLFFCFRIKKTGVENIPKEGGAILAVNHTSNWDVLVVGTTFPRTMRYMAKAEMFKNRILGGLFKSLGAFPVHRGRGDIGAVKSAFEILNEQQVMLMFPEGKRVKKNIRTEAKAGVAMIASKAKVPVIPVHIIGDYKWMGKIVVVYGKPIEFSQYYDKKVTMDELQRLSNDVLSTIYNSEA